MWSWGSNSEGQLGLGHTNDVLHPQCVDSLGKRVVLAAARGNNSAALLDNHRVFTWGSNSKGQLGLGPNTSSISTLPSEVRALLGNWQDRCL